MKRFSVYLRVTAEQVQAEHMYVTAPSAVVAVQSAMTVRRLSFVHHALAFDVASGGLGESVTLIDFVYRPTLLVRPRKAVR